LHSTSSAFATTSVAANYRAAGRARSQAEFVAKIGIVVEEADETMFWLELASDAELVKTEQTHRLLREADELLRIFVASQNTAKRRV
jgi:four helix bundle protein